MPKTFLSAKLLCTVLLLLIQLRMGLCQDQPDSTYTDFGVSLGLNSYQIKEQVLNNIRHTGVFPALGFSYEWSTTQIRQRVELYLIVNMVKSRYEEETAPIIIDPALSYTQVRKIYDFEPELQLFLGGTGGLYSHMGYFDNWDDSHIYWLTYYYLGINALVTYKNPTESSGYLEFGLPLISLVSRPPQQFLYKTVNDKFSWIFSEIHNDLRFTSIHEHLVLNLDLGYKFRHSASFQQKVYWRMAYTNTQMSYSQEVSILTHTIGTILLF